MKKIKKSFWKEVKEDYVESWKFIKDSKKFILFGILIFFIFALVGFFAKVPESISNSLLNYFKELVEMTADYGALKMILFIFFNNLKASFLGMIFGIIIGLFPLFNLFGNGFILGFASKYSVSQNGFLSLFRLVPHGIFELPAIFLALGLGLKLGTFAFEKKNKFKVLREYLINCLKVFVLIIFPLLVIAAIIEGLLIVL